jgi:hypothetical protein
MLGIYITLVNFSTLLQTLYRVKQQLPGATSMFIILVIPWSIGHVIVINILKFKDCTFFKAPYFLIQDLSSYSTMQHELRLNLHVPFMEMKIRSLSINKIIKYLVLLSSWTCSFLYLNRTQHFGTWVFAIRWKCGEAPTQLGLLETALIQTSGCFHFRVTWQGQYFLGPVTNSQWRLLFLLNYTEQSCLCFFTWVQKRFCFVKLRVLFQILYTGKSRNSVMLNEIHHLQNPFELNN